MEGRALCKRADDTKGEAVLVQMIVGAHLLKYSNTVERLNSRAVNEKEGNKLMREESRKATKAAKEALQLAKKADDKFLIGTAYNHLARIHLISEKYENAAKAKDDALELFREIGDQSEECISTVIGAEILFRQQKHDPAIKMATQALEQSRKIQDAHAEAYAVEVLNAVYSTQAPAETSAGPAIADAPGEASPVKDDGPKEVLPYAGPTADDLRPKIQELALSLLGSDEVEADAPLMDSGLDSLSMVQFRNTLQQQFQGVSMPASLIFDHPNVTAVCDYIAGELKDMHGKQ